MWKKLLGLMLGLLVLSPFNLVSAGETQDPWEKWAAEHIYKVQVVERVKYDNGQVVKMIVYISPDLKNGKVIGSAHYEDRDHDVISFEQAEEEVWSYFSSPWVITPDCYYLYRARTTMATPPKLKNGER